jgi:hypothetical protein
MVSAEDIARAERILQIVYREKEVPRQLRESEVDYDAFNSWLLAREDTIQRAHQITYRRTDPRIIQAFNTLLMHFFLVGLVCGRDETREIV